MFAVVDERVTPRIIVSPWETRTEAERALAVILRSAPEPPIDRRACRVDELTPEEEARVRASSRRATEREAVRA